MRKPTAALTARLEITEANLEAMVREYQALTFSSLHRKLSERDASRMLEIEEALERIPLA